MGQGAQNWSKFTFLGCFGCLRDHGLLSRSSLDDMSFLVVVGGMVVPIGVVVDRIGEMFHAGAGLAGVAVVCRVVVSYQIWVK